MGFYPQLLLRNPLIHPLPGSLWNCWSASPPVLKHMEHKYLQVEAWCKKKIHIPHGIYSRKMDQTQLILLHNLLTNAKLCCCSAFPDPRPSWCSGIQRFFGGFGDWNCNKSLHQWENVHEQRIPRKPLWSVLLWFILPLNVHPKCQIFLGRHRKEWVRF